LREAPGVADAAIFGDKLHVLLREGAAAETLQPFLRERGVMAEPPRPIAPTLEDVFVQLVSRHKRAEGGA
jgi:ABC-2 type transport system ATP-binding protein